MATTSKSLAEVCEIIPGRLYFATAKTVPRNTDEIVHYCTDKTFQYENFYLDFGPLNLSMLYRYSMDLKKILNADVHKGKQIVHYTAVRNPADRSNAAYLIGSFAVLFLGKTPDEALAMLNGVTNVIPFRDASYGQCTYKLTLEHCFRGLYQALIHGFIDFSTFDPYEYEFYERVENGDFNWVVPGKFLAFAGPHEAKRLHNGYPHLDPEHYFEYFKEHDITDVVRLNVQQYKAARFTKGGFKHHELYFVDGSTPPQAILKKFLALSEAAEGCLAVHCKAGLGRTGSLIACYMMKHYKFTAQEAIAWLRISRPGSVIGPQQYWLEEKQEEMWLAGDKLGVKRKDSVKSYPQWTVIDTVRTNDKKAPQSPAQPLKGNQRIGSPTAPQTPVRGAAPLVPRAPVKSNSAPVLLKGSQGDRLNAIKAQRSHGALKLDAAPISQKDH